MFHLNANQKIQKLKVLTVTLTVTLYKIQDCALLVQSQGYQVASALNRVNTAIGISTLKMPSSYQGGKKR